VVATGLGRPVSKPAREPAAPIAPQPTIRVVRHTAPLAASDFAAFDKPTVHRRAVGDGLRNQVVSEDLLDIPAFLRRQAD